jgi:hypothetical protein
VESHFGEKVVCKKGKDKVEVIVTHKGEYGIDYVLL